MLPGDPQPRHGPDAPQVSEGVVIVSAHQERVTLRVAGGYLKIDGDDGRLERERAALAFAPVPTPGVRWRRPHVLALDTVGGRELGRLGVASTASPAAWRAAGAAARRIHEAVPPADVRRAPLDLDAVLGHDGRWLVEQGVVDARVVATGIELAATARRPFAPVFIHGDLQSAHVFIEHDEVTGIIDWGDAGLGPAPFDLAVLTVGHEEHLADVVAGYGADVDLEVVRAWWAFRRLASIRWVIEHGFDPAGDIAALEHLVTA